MVNQLTFSDQIDNRPGRLSLDKELSKIAKVDLDSIAQERHSTYTFSFIAEVLGRIARLFLQLRQSDLSVLPEEHLESLTNLAREYLKITHRIESFGAAENQASEIEEIRKAADKLHLACINPITISLVASLIQSHSAAVGLGERLESSIGQVQETVSHRLQSLNQAENDAQRLIKSIKETAKEAGMVEHARIFSLQAHEHERAAYVWLGISVVLTMLTLWFAWHSYSNYLVILTALSVTQSIQLALSKLLILSVLFSALVWCGKSYRAQQHNYVVSKHRQNALSTFQVFTQAATDEQTKNAVLLQATQCIFSAQPSGYITQENEVTTQPQILEIFRGISSPQVKQ